MDCIFLNHCYQQWLRIKNCSSKHKYFVNIKSDLFSIFLVKQHNTQKCPKNSYIFLILEPIGRFVHCKKCSPPNMANKMSLNSYLDHHLCLIFQIWLHNNASWQKGHLIVHLAIIITWKRRFDVIITYLLRCVFAGALFHSSWCFTAGQVHGNRKGLILVKLSSLAPLNFVKITISV